MVISFYYEIQLVLEKFAFQKFAFEKLFLLGPANLETRRKKFEIEKKKLEKCQNI